jgi:exosortase
MSLPLVELDEARSTVWSRARSLNAAAWGLTLASLALIFCETFIQLELRWRIDPSYSHGYLVPVISIWLAFQGVRHIGGWAKLKENVTADDLLLGGTTLLVGLLLHFAGWLLNLLLVDVFGLVLIMRSLLWLAGGRKAVEAFGFAVLFLILMAPLPLNWQQWLASSLQNLVSHLSAVILTLLGIPVAREGYLLHLPGQTLEVAEACSGIRQLTAFLALTVAYVAQTRPSFWSAFLWILSSLPIAIAANTLRIVLTGVIYCWLGPSWAEGVFHLLEGLATVAVGGVLLLGVRGAIVLLERWMKSC